MKQFLLLIIAFCLCQNAKAQGVYEYTGDYLYSPFDAFQDSCTRLHRSKCPYWEGDCYEEWSLANGTPMARYNNTDRVFMWGAGPNSGEGIYHPFDFSQGSTYNIFLGIAALDIVPYSDSPSTVEVWAISQIDDYLARYIAGGTLPPQQCGETHLPYESFYTLPDPSLINKPQLLVSYSVGGSTNPAITSLTEIATISPSLLHDYSHIVVLVKNSDLNFAQTNFQLDYIRVCSPGIEQYVTGQLPGGLTSRDGIFISNGPVTNDPNKKTTLKALHTSISPNFVATINEDNYLLILPRECCQVITDPGEPGDEANSNNFGGQQGVRSFCGMLNKPEGGTDSPSPSVTDYPNESRFMRNSAALQPNTTLKLYPNPVNNVLHISNTTDEKYTISDVTGRILLQGNIQSGSIDMGAIRPGNYLINVVANDGTIFREKFVKQ